MKRCKDFISKHSFVLVLIICIIAIVLTCLFHLGILNKPRRANISTSSLLTDAIDIAELSTAEFKYIGIADIYTDESRTNVHCRACYSATVKAGINVAAFKYDIDPETKIVTASLPEIILKVSIIDAQSIALLPSDSDVELAVLLKYCLEDAESEAWKSEELINTARENLKSTIEGLWYPILHSQGYTLKWE